MDYPDPANVTEKDYATFLTSNWGSDGTALISKYLPYSLFNGSSAPGFAIIETIATAWDYQCPAFRGLNTAAKHGIPVWAYNFAHSPSCPWLPSLSAAEAALLGPTHMSEIPFVFRHTQGLPAPNGTCTFTAAEIALSDFMAGAWDSMAANRRPADNATWPAWTGPGMGPGTSLGMTFVNGTRPGYIDFAICQLFDQIEAMELANATTAANSTTGGNATITGAGGLPASSTASGAAAPVTVSVGAWGIVGAVAVAFVGNR